MTRPPGKINSAAIFTKKAIRILIVLTIIRKRTTTTKIPSPAQKVKSVLKPVQIYEEV